MLDYDIVACIASVVLYVIIRKKNRKIKRRYWVRPSLRNRPNVSLILEDFRKDDINRRNIRSKFNTFLRISSEEFEILLNLTGPMISKTDTRWRNAVSASDRLTITLRYLATGDSYFSLGTLFKVSPQVISLIIPDVCQALVSILSNYLRMPNTQEEWLSVARSFMQKWNVPNCVGALDGKHIRISCPINSGSEFFNYKSYFSIVLLALIDANYNFLYVDIGCQGRISDGGVLRNSTLFDMIRDGTLSLPQAIPLQGRNTPVPFYFIGDDAFPISQNIIKPFSGYHAKGSPERVFNYRISRGRMVVEDAFGILSNKFRILHSRVGLQNEKAKLVVMACVHLHNFMKRNETTTDGVLNEEQQNIPQIALNVEPSVIRNELKCYFLNMKFSEPFKENSVSSLSYPLKGTILTPSNPPYNRRHFLSHQRVKAFNARVGKHAGCTTISREAEQRPENVVIKDTQGVIGPLCKTGPQAAGVKRLAIRFEQRNFDRRRTPSEPMCQHITTNRQRPAFPLNILLVTNIFGTRSASLAISIIMF